MTTPLPATATSTTASATTALPPGTSASPSVMANMTAAPPVEDLWGLPVVDNATNLATSALLASASRPTSCPGSLHVCDQYRGWSLKYDSEWDRCSCGLEWDSI